ncbi:MAG: HAD hydrolase family protein, partial [Oscillospiraceae bacterium]|nr:HAD hydrolase family protein [Oscillospiraceae bacterium]
MKKFSKKLLLATDMDGTLLTTDKRITKENLDAIDKFTKAGGIFTIATGRSLLSA